MSAGQTTLAGRGTAPRRPANDPPVENVRPATGAAPTPFTPVSVAPATCPHCGNTFTPVEGRTEYCCAGCEFVHRLITGQKLDKFYELRRGAAAPVRSVVFQPRDYRWLEGLVRRAESSAAGEATLDLDVQGISCVGCVWLIDRLWRERDGARGIRVNATLGRLHLAWTRGACDVVAAAQELQRFGYVVGPATKMARTESNRLVLRLGLCAAFALNGMLFSLPGYLGMTADFPFAGLFAVLSFVFASASVVVGGTHFVARAWRSLRRGVLHIDLPIALGILVGYAGSIYAWTQAHGGFTYFDFVSTFTFLMLVGRWTQLAAVERNRHRLLGLRQELPDVELLGEDVDGRSCRGDEAERDTDGLVTSAATPGHRAVATKPAIALVTGDRFIVEPGQVVPVAATLLGPAGSLGMDWINGESEARTAAPGQIVGSGAINLSPHALRVEALEAWPASLLARLLSTSTPAEWRNHSLERVIRGYLLTVLVVAGMGGGAWWAATGDVATTLQVVVSVLVVSCPCAIGVTLPLIDELAVATLRRIGVFVRSETLWARLLRVRKVIFDKTGTLTLESLVLRNPEVLLDLEPSAAAALWTLVRGARHPAAACVREAMMAGGGEGTSSTTADVREEVGFGLELRDVQGRVWRLGRESWTHSVGPDLASAPFAPDSRVDARSGSTGNPTADLAFACDGVVIARFVTAEEVREDAVDEVARLRARGLEVYILSGDRGEKVAAMARRLGLSDAAAIGAMTPDAKAEWVRTRDAGDTLMIGDGANDSLAFDAATCRGTPAVERGLLENRSDFFFLGRGLAGIGRMLTLTAQRQRAMRHVVGFAIIYNLAAVAFALAGVMSPLLAAVLMPASALASLAIALVSMRGR